MISLDIGLWRGQAAGFSPLSLSPALWLDASDASTLFQSNGGAAAAADGDPVGYWLDKSGNGRHLTQTSGINKPLLKLSVKNSRNGVQFNGTSAFLNMTSYTHGTSVTCFRVFQRTSSSSRSFTMTDNLALDGSIWWEYNSKILVFNASKTCTSTNTDTRTGYFLARSTYTTTSDMALWVNGSSVAGGISGTASSVLAWTLFGKASSVYNTGNVCEDIVIPSVLSTDNINLMESYLNSKWGIY